MPYTCRWCLAFVFVAGSTLWAQTGAEITGTVTDVSGAVVPHAKVTVTNEATQGLRVFISGSASVYDVPLLVPGSYIIAVEMRIHAAFVTPPPYTYGNVGRNRLTGPSLANIDLSLIKKFVLHEGQALQFRAEAFNSLNHPNFSPPLTTLNSASFGTITSTVTPMRQFQFALKFLF
jgi:hypothetical protein